MEYIELSGKDDPPIAAIQNTVQRKYHDTQNRP